MKNIHPRGRAGQKLVMIKQVYLFSFKKSKFYLHLVSKKKKVLDREQKKNGKRHTHPGISRKHPKSPSWKSFPLSFDILRLEV